MAARHRPYSILLMIGAIGAAPEQGNARTSFVHETGPIGVCINHAAGGRPWLEKTLWGLHDQEGGWIDASIQNRDGSRDFGPLQVNSWWTTRLAAVTGKSVPQIQTWLTHDACFNVEAAKWIFLSALRRTGDFWEAVGLYHSPSKSKQLGYATSVAIKLTKRYGATIFIPARARGSE